MNTTKAAVSGSLMNKVSVETEVIDQPDLHDTEDNSQGIGIGCNFVIASASTFAAVWRVRRGAGATG